MDTWRGRALWVGLPALLLVGLLALSVSGPGGLWELEGRTERLRAVQAEQGATQAATDRLAWELSRADADSVVLERLLAEEHGRVAPGATLYRFDEADGVSVGRVDSWGEGVGAAGSAASP